MAHSFLQSESNLLHYHFRFCYVVLQDIFSAVINTVRANKKSFKTLDMNSAVHCN